MNIDRHRNQGELNVALKRLKFVLDAFEKDNFGEVEWTSKTYEERDKLFQYEPIQRCSIEEILGALVSAEQQLKEFNGDSHD